MKTNQVFLIVLSFIFFSISTIEAQKIKHKFGKLNPGEAEMKFYEQDSSASAVILYDKGHSYFLYDNNSGFKIMFKRDVRIKIFKKDAYTYANFEIPLYIGSSGAEELVLSLKGRTFNLENGKVVTTKVNKSNIFYDKKSKHLKIAKIAFPSVKEGSVIDLEYQISSNFIFNMRGWQFQYKIPVKYSEYSALIPEFFNYHKNQKGYDNVILTQNSDNRDESFTVYYKTLPQAGGVVETGSYELPSVSKLLSWKTTDVPAFIEEPYITAPKNFMTALEFELISIAYPQKPIEYFTGSWADINKRLLKSPYFGLQLKPTKKIRLQAEEICRDANTDIEKVAALYNWVKKNIKWNHYRSKYIEYKLNDILIDKKGNSADINMLLINMLKAQQINVNPVILSTRSHGMIFPTYPSLTVFDYVIAEVKINDKTYLLDATDENLPFGLLPFRCLNGTGRQLGTAGEQEIKIVPAQKKQISSLYTLTINPGEDIKGTVSKTYKGYAAYKIRNDIEDKGGQEEYVTKMIDNSDDPEISEVIYSNIKNIDKPIKESYHISTSDNITFAGNLIYLTPLLNEKTTDNPFKLDDRKYPVDYGYPYNLRIIMQYTIPEGYEISEKPENTAFSLPGRAAQFQFQVSVAGNMVQVISIFKINKTVFQYDSYKALKNFYDLLIKKQNEKIVLKKI